MKRYILFLAVLIITASCSKKEDNTPQVTMGDWQVACGTTFSFVIKPDHTLWATGSNSSGQFGNGTTTSSSSFVKVMENVKSVAAGDRYAMIIKTDNTLWATGNNLHGQMGAGTTVQTSTPVKIMDDVKTVSVGWESYTLILKNDGSVWGCGENADGQVGGTNSPANIMTPIKIKEDIKAVSAGEYHALLLANNGDIWSMGDPISAPASSSFTDLDQPYIIYTPVHSSAIAAGPARTFLMSDAGPIWGAGANYFHEMGVKDTIHTLITTVDSICEVLYIKNISVVGSGVLVYTAIPSPGTSVTYLLVNGFLFACGSSGDTGFGDNNPGAVYKTPRLITDGVKSISVNGNEQHVLIVKTDNSIWGTGPNGAGELGDGTKTDRSSFVPISIPNN